MANYHHMLKRKGQAEYEAAGHVNIPLWKEGDERRVAVGGDQIYVCVIERMDRERIIYTVEIDPPCVVQRADERRVDYALELDQR